MADQNSAERKDAPHDPLIGRTIAGKLVIERLLGGGAMGAVYLARQTALEKKVAVKVMHARLATDRMFAARFHREAKAASRLDHANSVRVLDFGEEPDGLLYLAMEYLEGRNLHQVIHEDWPISKERAIDILGQALAALAVAHDMGVVHRDLKPENMMILAAKDDDGKPKDVVKVCDFGIAKLSERPRDDGPTSPVPGSTEPPAPSAASALTSHGVVVGTPEYMSPEQGKGEPLDARSDLYSIGIILYQLLVGRVPFQADSAIGVVMKQVMEEPKPPSAINPNVDRALEAICMKAIKKPMDARYQSARELRAELRAALDGASHAPPPAPLPTTPGMLAPTMGNALGTAPTMGGALGTAPTMGDALGTAPTMGGALGTAPTFALPSTPPPQMPSYRPGPPQFAPASTGAGARRADQRSPWTWPLVLTGAVVLGALIGKDGLLKLIRPSPHIGIVGQRTDAGTVELHEVEQLVDGTSRSGKHVTIRIDDQSKPTVVVDLTPPSLAPSALTAPPLRAFPLAPPALPADAGK